MRARSLKSSIPCERLPAPGATVGAPLSTAVYGQRRRAASGRKLDGGGPDGLGAVVCGSLWVGLRCADLAPTPSGAVARDVASPDGGRRTRVSENLEKWSGRGDSNARPQPWQGCALPLSYARAPERQDRSFFGRAAYCRGSAALARRRTGARAAPLRTPASATSGGGGWCGRRARLPAVSSGSSPRK